jgi:uncharacterized protein (UPF0332 family)
MATWFDMSNDSLGAAKLLLQKGRMRSCVSRSYYATYAGGTAALLAAGAAVGDDERPNPSHYRLAKLMKHNLDPKRFGEATRKDVSRRVRNLRRARELAEYDPSATIDKQLALQCVRDASVVLATIGASDGS